MLIGWSGPQGLSRVHSDESGETRRKEVQQLFADTLLTCTRWCRRTCAWRCPPGYAPCTAQSPSAWCGPPSPAKYSPALGPYRLFLANANVPALKLFHLNRSWKQRIESSSRSMSKYRRVTHQVVSSRKIPSRSKCINSSPPLRYSKIKYSFPHVWNAYTKSTMNGC